jgi:hypothetical protein
MHAPKTRDRYEAPAEDDARRLRLVADILETAREHGFETTSYLAAFLTVARHPGLGPTGYAKLLGTIQPIMSRILLEIGRQARAREEGLGVVDSEIDPDNFRQRKYFLTPTGLRLYEDLIGKFATYERGVTSGEPNVSAAADALMAEIPVLDRAKAVEIARRVVSASRS